MELGFAAFIRGPIGLSAGVILTGWELYDLYSKHVAQAQQPNENGEFQITH